MEAGGISILIVDDHQIVRQGLRTYLELHEDVTVVGEAADGAEAVEKVVELAPDVVLMDLVMPGMDGISATRRIRELGARGNVIILSSFGEDDQIFPALDAGAVSYLLKDVSPDDLIAAVRAASRGEPHLHPEVTRKLMAAARAARSGVLAGAPVDPGSATVAAGETVAVPQDAGVAAAGSGGVTAAAPAGAADDLTERELDVIRLVAQGHSNREIAQLLFISEKTVKTHVSHILTKLGLKDRTQLAIHAIKSGLCGE